VTRLEFKFFKIDKFLELRKKNLFSSDLSIIKCFTSSVFLDSFSESLFV